MERSLQETATTDLCERALQKLLRYCRDEKLAGYDPYDGLNSPLAKTFLVKNRLARTILIQAVKRSPINLRPLLGIKKEINPKGIALAARAIILLARHYRRELPSEILPLEEFEPMPSSSIAAGLQSDFRFLISTLASLRSSDYKEVCWGYNFDWQSRAFFAPRGTPNVVCTVFAAHAFLDWHDLTGSASGLDIAVSSCRFLLDHLNRASDGDSFCFSYTPLDRSRVHNVNLLAAELLARVYEKTGDSELFDAASRSTHYTIERQREDGSWPYGEARSQSWIDGFHTGYVLVSLLRLIEILGRPKWRENLDSGYEFYRERFFLADGTPGYYHDNLYPIDAHSAAQAVITFLEMNRIRPKAGELAMRAVDWAIKNMQDGAGHFYFQLNRLYKIKTPHMRWSQTWMLYALSLYLTRSPLRENV